MLYIDEFISIVCGRWYEEACCDFTLPLEQLLDPPAVCLRPDWKDLLSKFNKYGLMFRC